MRRDLWLHVGVSALLAVGLRSAGVGPVKAGAVALSVGVIREAIQAQGREGWRDMGANVLGVSVGLSLPLPRNAP